MPVFEIIMSPFIYIIKYIFLFSYQITGDYGTAIILLSFSISLLLLPIFILIEKAKKKDDIIKNRMQPLIDEIKRVYKGQERYYYIKTINRQHNYNSLKSLIPILSLLLQIPFFIAAFQFLDGFEPLKGESFLFIKDLSQADGLFGFINFLPILMTVVNLVTAYFYTRNGNTSERKKMYIVAGAFLVLLFNLPSGLVLYWTMNNVFSFLRLFITNPEVFKNRKRDFDFEDFKSKFKLQLPSLKKIFIGILLVALFTQFKWAFENNFDNIYLRIGGASITSIIFTVLIGIYLIYARHSNSFFKTFSNIQIFYSISFLSIYFYLASKFYYPGENISLGIIASFFLIPSQVFGYYYTFKFVKKTSNFIHKQSLFILCLLTIYQISIIISIIINNEITFNFLNNKILIDNSSLHDFMLPGIYSILIGLIYYYKLNKPNYIKVTNRYLPILALSILYIAGFIFLWNPLSVYSSFPDSFNFSAIDILKTNFSLFILSIIGTFILYFILPNKFKRLLILLLLTISIVNFIYGSIIPIELGTLQMHKFSDIENLSKPNLYYLFEAILLLLIFLFISKILKKIHFNKIIIALSILNLITISQSVFVNIKEESFFSNPSNSQLKQNKNLISSEHFISFSKNNNNVVVIVLDMLQGWYLRKMIEDDSKIKNIYSGFKWYPNTVSISNYTASSAPSILAGLDYVPEKLDKDSLHTLYEKIAITKEILNQKVKNKSLNFFSSIIPYSKMGGEKIPIWSKDWDYLKPRLNIGTTKELEYSVLWQNATFFSLPLFIKPKIYNNGNWLLPEREANEDNKLSQHYNLLRVLPFISNTNTEKGSFIFFWSNASHFPYDIIDEKGNFIQDVSPYRNHSWAISKISKWIKWMKQNDVYNNSKIIILSDHGIRHAKINDTTMVINPFIPKEQNKVPMKELLSLTPLMMVKDYNESGELKEDWRLLINADTYSIAFDENDPTKIEPPLERKLKANRVSWKIKVKKDTKIPITKIYEVTNNIYEIKNWKRIK